MRRVVWLLAAAILLSGCWSRKEISETAFVTLLAVDVAEENLQVTINILLSTGVSGARESPGGGSAPLLTVQTEAPTINEALRQLQRIATRRIFLGHLRAVYIGEELAKQGIGPLLSHLSRMHEVRPTVWVGVTKGEAAAILTAAETTEAYPSNGPLGYHDLIQRMTTFAPATRVVAAIAELNEEGRDLVLPVFHLSDPDGNPKPIGPSAKGPEAIFGGAAIFREDRLVGWLNLAATRGLLYARGLAVHDSIPAPCGEAKRPAVFGLRDNRSKISLQIGQTSARALLKINVTADIQEAECIGRPVTENDLQLLRRSLTNAIRQDVEQMLNTVQPLQADPLGIGQQLFRHHPGVYGAMSGQPGRLGQIPIEMEVAVDIPRTGELYGVIRSIPKP